MIERHKLLYSADILQFIKELRSMHYRDKIAIINEGFTRAQLDELKRMLDIDYETLADILTITSRTILLKADHECFNQNVSDRIMSIMDVYSLGFEIFKDASTINRWLHRENHYFRYKRPLELMQTIVGVHEVRAELLRAMYGTF